MTDATRAPQTAAADTPADTDTRIDAHSASLIDALARRIQAESEPDADTPIDAQDPEAHADEAPQAEGPGFASLGLSPALCHALSDAGYTQPTGVQVQAIPAALNGTDLLVASSTGSGKTAAFMLPALERIIAARGDGKRRDNQSTKGKVHGPRVLVLAPTRELAMQVAKAATTYGKHLQGLRVATVVGGVPYGYQLKALKGPLDVLIATPGRLLDHIGTGAAVLSNVEVLVLDEADRMLDMGFIDDIEQIAEAIPAERQTLMFSATFAGHVGALAQRLTRDAESIAVASHTDSHDNIEQRLHLADSLAHKNDLLDHLLTDNAVDQAVIFTSTQRDADILADRLADMGHAVAALHGGMPQGRRNRVLQALRSRQLRVLVATDVAARGIDVPTITHVINYGMPMKAEDYVHRIGRTGRAGRSGLALTLAERRDIPMVRRIERFTTQRIPEAVIAGLEPKTKLLADKGPRRDKPMPGHGRRDDRGPRFGGHGSGHGNFGGGKREGGWGEPRGFAPREDRGFTPREDRPSFKPQHDPRFEGASGDRGFAPREDRGFGGKRFEERGPGKSFGDRPFGDRGGFGDRPQGDRPFGDRGGFGDKPHGKSFGKPFGDKPFGGKPAGKSFGGKPFGDRSGFGDRPQGDRPFGDRPQGDRAFGDKPFGKPAGKSFGDRPFGDKPAFKSAGFKSGGPKPGFGGKRPGFGKREG
ncbi:DEAD/DEAH box helicase [Aquabacterium sp.]|uniref:DEAD/DEAH box helicase n=1 Tax=Aquabacterium sp. TaxID=1872578 RepID=UPI0035C77284